MRAPRSGFQRWFGPQYKGWISYEQRPPSGKMTHFFSIRGLSLLLLPALSFLSARCASRGKTPSFEPQLIQKHQTRLDGFEEKILTLYARGMTTRDIQAQVQDLYGKAFANLLFSLKTGKTGSEAAFGKSLFAYLNDHP